ncbi:hypothetical protein CU097_012169 [Rhizopus azygosporus]|uniref:Phosphoesterase-domain-containing protein n=1 Tax=Rhizopus azygosporus TaxID=86630 RepID=A0A367JVF4_RHIAZ|nr:hypothetical protein CU097_012169 [Rhizopus azygosporus]
MKFTLVSAIAIYAGTILSTIAADASPEGKAFNHFLQIWFENQNFKTISRTPGFTNLQKYGILMDNYNALTHPSQPNYVASVAGSNIGIVTDHYYNIPSNIPSVFDRLEEKGLTWKMYQEDLPFVGFTGYKYGRYVRKHNPAASFDSIALNNTRVQNIVHSDQLMKDIKAQNLPNWMFYTPNMDNDGHDTNAAYAGNWLSKFYESTLNEPYLLNNTVILITFDETANYMIRNRVWSLLFGAVPEELKGTTDSTFYTHYSILRTVEKNWDLKDLGGGDIDPDKSNVFQFVASKINHTNAEIKKVPWNNTPMFGPLSGKSKNTTRIFIS